ncbi:MAG: hypothetical protein ACPGYP_09035 [Solirubrobacterales bacterium]
MRARPVRSFLVFLSVAVAMAAPGGAWAHQSNPDYESTVRSIEPATEGVDAWVEGGDDTVVLVNRSGRTVIALGYDDEPYVRIDADGRAFVNERSPALYLNEDRYAKVEVPSSADADAEPAWRRVGSAHRYQWHDHRAHWMGEQNPPTIADATRRTKVFDWKVPIVVGDRNGEIVGDLYWRGDDGTEPRSAATLVFALVVATMVIAALTIILVRRRRGRAGGGETGKRESW